jgi:phenylacetate-CoA ligase
MRAQIEALLPLKALDIYGLSEVIGPGVACECVEAQAGLHVNEDHFLVEVVDPGSGRPVPPGERGELVFTTLTKEAMPLLRYRTGDIAALDRSPCACGRTLARMSKVTGRRDDMLVIRGVNIYPSEVEAVLVAERAVAPHYLLVVDRTRTMPRLVVACELATGWSICAETEEAERERVAAEVGAALLERLGLTCEVRVLPGGTVPRVELGKAVRVVQRTPDHDPLPALGG